MTASEVLSELKGQRWRRVYLLMGPEPYPIDQVSDWIEAHALTPDERTWNQTVLYGRETSGRAIALECQQLPMMASRRVVIVKEAQATPGLADLDKYADNPAEQTVLVLCHKYKDMDRRSRLLRAVEKGGGALVESPRLHDYQMPHWIAGHARSLGLEIEEKAAALLAEHVGCSMGDANAAFQKIRAAVGPELRRVTADMVADNVGISKDYNSFELRDALFNRNEPKALRIVKAFGSNEKQYPIQAALAALYNAFDKLFAFTRTNSKDGRQAAIKKLLELGEKKEHSVERNYVPAAQRYTASQCFRALRIIADADMRSKGFQYPPTSNRDLLIDVVCQIIRL